MGKALLRCANDTIVDVEETSIATTVQVHRFDIFAGYPELTAGVTGRPGGVSIGPYESLNLGFHVGDDPTKVEENRRRLCQEIGFDLDQMVVPQQVHEGTVASVGKANAGRGARSHDDAIAKTDALVSNSGDVLLAVMLADCVPVVIFDPVNRVVAVAHAGWGGTVAQVTTNTVRAMIEEFGADAAQMVAGIGPSIGPASYEVQDDVAFKAEAAFPGAGVIRVRDDGSKTFDLWKANHIQLRDCGIPESQIEIAAIDTYSNFELYFSDRRDRPCGRFMCFASIRDSA